jgi:hypothetical protein
MPPKPCTDCGKPTLNTRCGRCQGQRERARNAQRPHYQGDWPALSRRIRAEWVDTHGWLCPGWQRDAHPSTDLVVDHVQARSRTELAILCRVCNSRKSVNERPHR